MEKEPLSPIPYSDSDPPGAISRLVGAHLSEEERHQILKEKNEAFSHQERPEWSRFEVERTSAQDEMLGFINAETNTLLQHVEREK